MYGGWLTPREINTYVQTLTKYKIKMQIKNINAKIGINYAIHRRIMHPANDNPTPPSDVISKPTLVSLGYRCSTAGIIKRLHRKTESYPFDWMISRLSVIRDCIQTQFRYFIDSTQYAQKRTHTTHYHEGSKPTPRLICNESVHENTYYQTHEGIRETASARIPQPLSIEKGDTYASIMAFNHRDIREDNTQEYYKRCIDRFYAILDPAATTRERIIGLYIHQTITEQEYAEQHQPLCDEFRDFYQSTLPEHWSAVFFIMVRTDHPYPITAYKPNVIECVYTESITPTRYMRVYVVYTNRDFIDAGEIFMQNAYIETDTMCELIGGL
jgi:hypothetical protein